MTSMNATTREVLELFVEKARVLDEGRFVGFISTNGLNLDFDITVGQPVAVSVTSPDDEASLALAVTFRQFFQPNERISFGKIEPLLSDPDLSPNFKAQFLHIKKEIDDFLAEDSRLQLTDGTPTNNRIMEVFLYGLLAHSTPDKRAQIVAWRSDPKLYLFVENEFKSIVVTVLNAINYIVPIIEAELEGQFVPAVE